MSSTAAYPPDTIIIAELGNSLINVVAKTCTFTVIYGIFVFLFSRETVLYLKRKQASQAQFWMFVTSTITFILATIHEASFLATLGIFIYSSMVKFQNLPWIERPAAVNDMLRTPDIVAMWISGFEPIISDCIVVWRAYVLLQRRRQLVILPSLFLLGSLASLLVAWIILTGNADIERALLANNLNLVGFVLSLATNISATALIGYIYWHYRRDIVGSGKHRPTDKVLALLVESGVVFCTFQTISFGLGFSPEGSNPGTTQSIMVLTFTIIYQGFSVIYPTAVIALVNSQRTLDHICSTNASSPEAQYGVNHEHVTTLQFAERDFAASSGTLAPRVEKRSDSIL